jgi:hypothetical protein
LQKSLQATAQGTDPDIIRQEHLEDKEGYATNIALAYMAADEYRVSTVVTEMSCISG